MTSERPRRHAPLTRAPLATLAAVTAFAAPAALAPAAGAKPAKPAKPAPQRSPVTPGLGRPFTIAAAAARDLGPAVLAFAPTDAAAAAFGIADEDDATTASARLALQQLTGSFAPARGVAHSQQVLAAAYRGDQLELLTGSSTGPYPCCSRVQALASSGAAHTVIAGLAGPALGRLVASGPRLLAAVSSEHGVWAAQSDTRGSFGPTRDLVPATSWPQSLDATALAGGRTVVVWTARPSQFAPGPTAIYFAGGSAASAPSAPAVAIAVRPTHSVDEIAVAAHGAVPTVAWIESWYDTASVFHSEAYAADLAGSRTPQRISAPTEVASGLALAAADAGSGANGAKGGNRAKSGNGAGGNGGSGAGQVLAYRACTRSGACVARAALRRRRFGAATTLGPIDSTQFPAVAQSAGGASLAAWIAPGGVRAAVAPPGAPRLQAPRTVAATGFAADLAVAFAPSGASAILAWTQGTFNQSLMAAEYGLPAARRRR